MNNKSTHSALLRSCLKEWEDFLVQEKTLAVESLVHAKQKKNKASAVPLPITSERAPEKKTAPSTAAPSRKKKTAAAAPAATAVAPPNKARGNPAKQKGVVPNLEPEMSESLVPEIMPPKKISLVFAPAESPVEPAAWSLLPPVPVVGRPARAAAQVRQKKPLSRRETKAQPVRAPRAKTKPKSTSTEKKQPGAVLVSEPAAVSSEPVAPATPAPLPPIQAPIPLVSETLHGSLNDSLEEPTTCLLTSQETASAFEGSYAEESVQEEKKPAPSPHREFGLPSTTKSDLISAEYSQVYKNCISVGNSNTSASTSERSLANMFQKELDRKEKEKLFTRTDGETSIILSRRKAKQVAPSLLGGTNLETPPLPNLVVVPAKPEKNGPLEIDKTRKSSHLSVGQTVEESKVEEDAKAKPSFERILPMKSDLKKLTESTFSYIHTTQLPSSLSSAPSAHLARPSTEPPKLVPTEIEPINPSLSNQNINPVVTLAPTPEPTPAAKLAGPPSEAARARAERPNQSFAQLSPEELKEKNAELNQLFMSIKLTGRKDPATGLKITTPAPTPVTAQPVPAVQASPVPPSPPRASPSTSSPQIVIESSDDEEFKDTRFAKKPWVNSPSLPNKIRMQNENQAIKIFGSSVNTKVNLTEMFSGMANLPPDSPNRFPHDKNPAK